MLEHELFIKGLNLPRWRTDLSPMYVGLNAERQYVLVGLIRGSYVHAKRGNPASPYVGFKVVGEKWVETPVPAEFNGRKATFLMATGVETGAKGVVTAKVRDFRNAVEAVGRVGTINLTKPAP